MAKSDVVELRKLAEGNKLVFGFEKTLAVLRNNGIARVFLSSNCTDEQRADVMHLCSLNKVEVVELDLTNEEIGEVCRKPFSISVFGVLK